MPNPVFHRLHPLSVLVELSRAIARLAMAFVFLVISFVMNRESDFTELLATGLGLLVVVSALIRYLTFRYAIADGNLYIKSGLLVKQDRTIPLDRIQNINLSRSLVHRLLGLVDVEIETASGTSAEANLSALTEDQAHILKAQLLGKAPGIASRVLEARRANVIYEASFKDLLIAGATENRLGTILATIVGFQVVLNRFMEKALKSQGKSGFLTEPLFYVYVGFGLIFVGWIFAIVSSVVRYYGFQLTLDEGKIKRQYGLINHIENVVPLNRIQLIKLTQNILQRPLKIHKVYVETAGAYGEMNDARKGTAGTSLITPIVRDAGLKPLTEVIYPRANLINVTWSRVDKKTIWRHIRSSVIPAIIVVIPIGIFFKYWAAAGYFGVMVLGLLSGIVHWKTAFYSDHEGVFAVRRGWFGRVTTFIPCDKVQSVTLEQSPGQRRLKLADLSVAAAVGSHLLTDGIKVEDMSEDDAYRLAETLHNRSARSSDSLLDGL